MLQWYHLQYRPDLVRLDVHVYAPYDIKWVVSAFGLVDL